ncbi:hypothetical protein [Bifidobacterium vansinderenii]|uniref:Uncharacterized protein n=1 Tax=Bifidobacterium vansinderenii TaxID=1984871 RepID=A0A229VZR7_9BIFI|nr:hypothetical protein [Bifidobacterium vansinderenii]OXN01114.1 hypothetical protein Tam10B_0693 [Bifidobacterium vansinderenii]
MSVNDDGSLHLSGTPTAANVGIRWQLPVPDAIRGETVTYSAKTLPGGTYAYLQLRGSTGVLATLTSSAPTATVPQETTTLELRIAANTTNPVDGTARIQLEAGDTATEWVKPDVTDLNGGGAELANLWPDIPTTSKSGVTLTNNGDGTYTLTGEYKSWTTFEATVNLESGTYSIEASEGLTSFDSWDLLLQVAPSQSGDSLIKPGTPAATFEAGRYRCQINVNAALSEPRTIRPTLNRIE